MAINLIDDFLKATMNKADDALSMMMRPRARMKSAAARAPKHVQALTPALRPAPVSRSMLDENWHITGTIPKREIGFGVSDLFGGRATIVDNTSKRSVQSVINRHIR